MLNACKCHITECLYMVIIMNVQIVQCCLDVYTNPKLEQLIFLKGANQV